MRNADVLGFLAFGAVLGGGCNEDALPLQFPSPPPVDIGTVFGYGDGGFASCESPEPCRDCGPRCRELRVGPGENVPFSLPADPGADRAVAATGVRRDANGWLVLESSSMITFQYLWLAHDQEGTVSKVDARTMKEVARYRTITCFSRPTGSNARCDGTHGCCAADSPSQWQNRKNGTVEGPAQQVQLGSNSPSRTAVDFNGDLFVANRAFGGQASVTKIANDPGSCRDRNGNGRIDTSTDVNQDGRIDTTDPREYLGPDDECVLWTTNHGTSNSTGRPLALGRGPQADGPSDVFAGGYETAKLYRIDGTTGRMEDEWQLPLGCHPYGLAVDSQGFGWAPNLGGDKLCYFDTHNSANVGQARGTMMGYGVTLDRDQNVWVGQGVARYTPDRRKGFATLGNGYWTRIRGLNGVGIAADSRNLNKYFVWSATFTSVVRIPASDIPLPNGKDVDVQFDLNWPRIKVPAYGIGIDVDQNVIAVPLSGAVTRTRVDAKGDFNQPDVSSRPRNGELCPAGDRCDLGSRQYTYSDFTGFGLRSFTRPNGTWSYVVPGCVQDRKATRWSWVTWQADVPPNTALSMRARSGPTASPDVNWGQWTPAYQIAPAFFPQGVLVPNGLDPHDPRTANYLQVEFTLKTGDQGVTPKLKSFAVVKCLAP